MKSLVIILNFLVLVQVTACKPERFDSNVKGDFDGNADLQNQQPATHYVLKDNLKRMISDMKIVQSGVEDGAHIYTVTKLKVDGFEPSQSGIKFAALLDVSVDAKKGQYIALGASGGANLSFQGQAKIVFHIVKSGNSIDLVYQGISWPKELTHYVSVWTNAVIARRAVLNGARTEAAKSIEPSKAKIRETISKEIQNNLLAQKANLRLYFDQIAQAMNDVPSATPKFYSEQGAAYFQHLLATKQGKRFSAPPQAPQTVDTGFSFNENFFSYLLNRNLAGKTLSISQLQVEICKSFTNFYYKLCEPKPVENAMAAALVFDPIEPSQFSFNDNRIQMTIRAQIKISQKEVADFSKNTGNAGTGIDMAKEGTPTLSHSTPQVIIRVAYVRDNRQFVRETVDVNLQDANEGDGAMTKSEIYRTALKMLLQRQFSSAVPSWLSVPAVPAYVTSDSRIQNFGGSFVIMDPEHFSAHNGWINAYYSYCEKPQTQVSMGIFMRSGQSTDGKAVLNVTGLHNNSPATKAQVVQFSPGKDQNNEIIADYKPSVGIQNGDVIFLVDESREALSSPELFGSFIAGRSLIPNRSEVLVKVKRQVQLENPEKGKAPVQAELEITYKIQLQKVCKTSK